jgi:hypothetical protein
MPDHLSPIETPALPWGMLPRTQHPSTNEHHLVITLLKFIDQVQAGGSFDLDYSVLGPNDRTVMEATKERQGDFVFTAKEVGEYRVCFDNDMSTFSEKTVDFEITV